MTFLESIQRLESRIDLIPFRGGEFDYPEQKLARVYRYFDLKNEFRHETEMENYRKAIGTAQEEDALEQLYLVCQEAIDFWIRKEVEKKLVNTNLDLRELG